jgi:hypothetical protein
LSAGSDDALLAGITRPTLANEAPRPVIVLFFRIEAGASCRSAASTPSDDVLVRRAAGTLTCEALPPVPFARFVATTRLVALPLDQHVRGSVDLDRVAGQGYGHQLWRRSP